MYCDEEGRWPTLLPVCVRVCFNPFLPFDNVIDSSNNKSFVEDDIATFSCKEGFAAEKEVQAVCQSDGSWSGVPSTPYCKQLVCLIPLDSHLILSEKPSLNTSIYFKCEPGYKLEGDNNSTCLESGSWSAAIPSCVFIDCGEPTDVPHGHVQYNLTTYKSQANYSCHIGYDLVGESLLTCADNFSWTPQAPKCIIVTCKGQFEQVSHGAMITNGMTYMSTADIICDEGYISNGTTRATCNEFGQWVPSQVSLFILLFLLQSPQLQLLLLPLLPLVAFWQAPQL